jgi:geranylgeranyl pyrophosphate synthase
LAFTLTTARDDGNRFACAKNLLDDVTPLFQRAMGRYGKRIGPAFQIIEDVLDYRSDQ